MTFCTDTDLLPWEPNLLREASFASQTLLTGTGDLAGLSGSARIRHDDAGAHVVFTLAD